MSQRSIGRRGGVQRVGAACGRAPVAAVVRRQQAEICNVPVAAMERHRQVEIRHTWAR